MLSFIPIAEIFLVLENLIDFSNSVPLYPALSRPSYSMAKIPTKQQSYLFSNSRNCNKAVITYIIKEKSRFCFVFIYLLEVFVCKFYMQFLSL